MTRVTKAAARTRTGLRLLAFVLAGIAGTSMLHGVGCGTGGGNAAVDGGDGDVIDIFAKRQSINVRVVDEDDSPVFGATAHVDGKRVAGTSDTDGVLKVSASTGSAFGLRISARGFVDNIQRVETAGADEVNVFAALKRVGTTQMVSPTFPATVLDRDAGGATFEANSFVTEDGGAVTGDVEVSVTLVRADEVAALGTFGINGEPDQVLQSLGALVISASIDGVPVVLAPGKSISITLPATIPPPDAGAEAGPGTDAGPPGTLPPGTPLPPVWRQNPNLGGWDSTPSTFTLSNNRWVAQVDSIATWNCDYPSRVTCVRGTATTPQGTPLGGATVTGRMSGSAAGFLPATTVLNAVTGSAGTFCLEVVPGSQLNLTIACPEGVGARVGPFTVSGNQGARCSGAGGSCSDLGTIEACCKTDADCAEGEQCRQGACVTGCANMRKPTCEGDRPFCCVIETDAGCSVGPHCDSIACSNFPNEVPCK